MKPVARQARQHRRWRAAAAVASLHLLVLYALGQALGPASGHAPGRVAAKDQAAILWVRLPSVPVVVQRGTAAPSPTPPPNRAALRASPTAAAPAASAWPAPLTHADEPAPATQPLPAAVALADPAAAVAPAPNTQPAALAAATRRDCPPAHHPAVLRERGIEGVVLLRVRVGTNGLPAEVQLQQPSGWRLLDEAALVQARACRFVPAQRGHEAVESWVEYPVRFALTG